MTRQSANVRARRATDDGYLEALGAALGGKPDSRGTDA